MKNILIWFCIFILGCNNYIQEEAFIYKNDDTLTKTKKIIIKQEVSIKSILDSSYFVGTKVCVFDECDNFLNLEKSLIDAVDSVDIDSTLKAQMGEAILIKQKLIKYLKL